MLPSDGWGLPGPRSFHRRIIQDLRNGRSIVALAPGAEAVRMLAEHCHDAVLRELTLPPLVFAQPGAAPAAAIATACGMLPEAITALEAPSTLFSDGWQALPVVATQVLDSIWSHFLEDWERRRIRIGTATAPIMLLSQPGTSPQQFNPGFERHWWWSTTSILEARLLVRDRMLDPSLLGQWQEHILVSVAGGDLTTVTLLAERWRSPRLDDLLAHLRALPLPHVSGTPPDLAVTATPPLEVPPGLWPWWRAGLVAATREHGMEYHPRLALSGVDGEEEMRYRIWRGETAFLFPLLEAHRVRLCRALTRRFGKGWATVPAQAGDPRDLEAIRLNDAAAGWGTLNTFARSAQLPPDISRQRPLIQHCWRLRNELAHHRLVTHDQITRLADLL